MNGIQLHRLRLNQCRESFRRLGEVRASFKGVPVLALTATAPMDVIEDLTQVFRCSKNPNGFEVYSDSVSRPNLRLCVVPKKKDGSSWAKLVQLVESGPVLVYANMKADCEKICKFLQGSSADLQFAYYHSDVPAEQKRLILDQWQDGTDVCFPPQHAPVYWTPKRPPVMTAGTLHGIVCTTAFGMGVNKLNVRRIIHWDVPKSLNEYCQAIGRAGRDGLPSFCTMFYDHVAVPKLFAMLDRNTRVGTIHFNDMTQVRSAHCTPAHLAGPYDSAVLIQTDSERMQVNKYCLNIVDCRHLQLSMYYNGTDGGKPCQVQCNVCNPDIAL